MEELYLNGQRADLKSNTVALTKQINNIAEMKDRQVGYSNAVDLPFTPRNKALMSYLGIAGNRSIKPYTRISVIYVVDGIELISDGIGQIKETTNSFKLIIYDNTKDLYSDIKGLTLADLDFSVYNQTIDTDIITGTKNNTSGFIYAIADFARIANSGNFLEAFSPSFFCHTLVDMIITQAGYTRSGAIFADADYKSRVYPMTKGTAKTITNNDFVTTDLDLTESTGTPVYVDETEVTDLGTFTQLIHTENCSIGDIYLLEITPNVLLTKTFGTDYKIGIDFGNGIDQGVGFYWDETFTGDAFVAQATTIKFYILTDYEEDAGDYKVKYNTNFNIKYTKRQSESFPISFENEIGDLEQTAFLKDIMQRFGLISRRIPSTNEYQFVQIKTLLLDKANAIDYSGKFSDFISESYTAPYAKLNCFKHKYDSTENDEEQTFADGFFEIGDFHLADEKTALTSVMTATDFVIPNGAFDEYGTRLTVDPTNPLLVVFNYKFYRVGTFGDIDFEEGFEPQTNKPRIFKLENRTKNESFVVELGSAFSKSLNESLPYLVFDGCDYQTELKNSYQEHIALVRYYHKINVNLNLNIVDFYKLNLFKLVYLNQFGRYYYINKVSNFKKGQKTKVELIQVNDVSPKFDSALTTLDSTEITFDTI